MAVYYPPPQPFVGGKQPLAPQKLTPPSNPPSADTPPPWLTPLWLRIVTGTWEPVFWATPSLTRKFVSAVVVVPPDVPPSNLALVQNLYIILRAWPQRDYGRPAGSEGNRTDNPPFGLLTYLWPIMDAWKYTVPPPQLNVKLTPPSVITPSDNPPIGWPPGWLNPVRSAWEPGPPLPLKTVGPLAQGVAVSADQPPAGMADALLNIIAAWQPLRYIPLWGAVVVLDNTLTPDNPPFGYDPYISIVRSTWDKPFFPWLPPVLLPQPSTVPVDNPPFGYPYNLNLWIVRKQWDVEPPLPWHGIFVVQIVPDNPPFGMPPAWLRSVLEAWQPGPPRPVLTTGPLVQEGALPILGLPLWLFHVLSIWNPPPDYRPFLRGPLQTIAFVPPPPPTGHGENEVQQWLRRLRWLSLRQGR